MKHPFKILFVVIYFSVFSLINLGYAIPPKQHNIMTPVTVQVTIHNQSSVASLKFWTFSYVRSFPSMSSYMPPLFPVNPNSSGSLAIKIPTEISASLSYGYNFSNFCLFLFSYSYNQLTVTPTPHGSVNCGTPVVSGKSVTLMINQHGQQQQQNAATNQIQFTIFNDSSLSSTYYKPPTSSSGPVSTPGLASIPPNSKLTFTATINRSLSKGTSVQIDYGIDKKNFCTFSLPIRQLGIKATVIKTTTKSTKYHMICTVENDNSMHVNIQLPSNPRAKCNKSGNWTHGAIYSNASPYQRCGSLRCHVGAISNWNQGRHQPIMCYNTIIDNTRGLYIQFYSADGSYYSQAFPYCAAKLTRDDNVVNLPRGSVKEQCAYLVSKDPYLKFNYGN